MSPLQYYLYGLGLGNGYRNRGLWNIVSGDMGLTSRGDFERFGQYRNRDVDTLVYQGNFRHAVSRSFQIGTGITLPIWDIGLTGDLQWKEDFSQSREYPLYTDTTTVWPKIGVGVSVPNFAQRISFLNSFRSVSTTHRFDFTKTTTVKPFQSAEDSWGYQINFNPLVRITFLTQKNLKIENSVRLKIETTDRRPKEEVIGLPCWPDSLGNMTDTTDYFWETPWIHTALFNDFAINVGDDFTISYPLKLKRGSYLGSCVNAPGGLPDGYALRSWTYQSDGEEITCYHRALSALRCPPSLSPSTLFSQATPIRSRLPKIWSTAR